MTTNCLSTDCTLVIGINWKNHYKPCFEFAPNHSVFRESGARVSRRVWEIASPLPSRACAWSLLRRGVAVSPRRPPGPAWRFTARAALSRRGCTRVGAVHSRLAKKSRRVLVQAPPRAGDRRGKVGAGTQDAAGRWTKGTTARL